MQVALKSLCPRCGARTLFAGIGAFAQRCRACGLDFQAFNVGDGPAAFLTLLVGTIILVLALSVDSAFRPPFWVHILLWFPLMLGAVIFSLRFAKALLLALGFANNAREGRVEERD